MKSDFLENSSHKRNNNIRFTKKKLAKETIIGGYSRKKRASSFVVYRYLQKRKKNQRKMLQSFFKYFCHSI